MKIALWIVQALLALAFLGAGSMKTFAPIENLSEGLPWVQDFDAWQVRTIGILELLAVVGLIAPMFVKSMRMLVPIAAICLILTMIGAMIVHLGREEPIFQNLILIAMLAFVVYGRKDFFSKAAAG